MRAVVLVSSDGNQKQQVRLHASFIVNPTQTVVKEFSNVEKETPGSKT